MLYLASTYRTSDVCHGSNVISCVIPVNLHHTPNGFAYFLQKMKRCPISLLSVRFGKIPIIDLTSITNCLFEVVFHRKKKKKKSVKIDSSDMKHLCFNFSSAPLVSHRHTCGPTRTLKLEKAASFDKPFPFSLNTTSTCQCRYVLRERKRIYPGAALIYEILFYKM